MQTLRRARPCDSCWDNKGGTAAQWEHEAQCQILPPSPKNPPPPPVSPAPPTPRQGRRLHSPISCPLLSYLPPPVLSPCPLQFAHVSLLLWVVDATLFPPALRPQCVISHSLFFSFVSLGRTRLRTECCRRLARCLAQSLAHRVERCCPLGCVCLSPRACPVHSLLPSHSRVCICLLDVLLTLIFSTAGPALPPSNSG